VTASLYVLTGSPTDEELVAVSLALQAIGEEIEQRRSKEDQLWSPLATTLRSCPAPAQDAWWSSQFRMP